MNRTIITSLWLVLFLTFSLPLYGQSVVIGQLTNSNHEPLDQASVLLFQVQDSSFVSFTVSQHDGSFQIPKVKPGLYYLQYTASGYRSSTSDPIRIHPERSKVITGRKVLYRQKKKLIVIKPARV